MKAPFPKTLSHAALHSLYITKDAPQNIQEASFVEMGGLEPPSKHRTRQLSTRLVSLWFSSGVCRKTGQLQLIL